MTITTESQTRRKEREQKKILLSERRRKERGQRMLDNIRQEIVDEISAVIERYPKSSKEANLRTAVAHRTTPELGVSLAEIAKAFYQEIFEDSISFVCYRASELIGRVKRNLRKTGVEFNSAMVSVPGRREQRLFYCMYAKDPNMLKVNILRQHKIDGIEESLGRLGHAYRRQKEIRERHKKDGLRLEDEQSMTTELEYDFPGIVPKVLEYIGWKGLPLSIRTLFAKSSKFVKNDIVTQKAMIDRQYYLDSEQALKFWQEMLGGEEKKK